MNKLYIIRAIKHGQTCHEADVGMSNILAMGKYMNVKNAMRFMAWDVHKTRALSCGYDRIALFDLNGVICSS